MTSHVYTVSRSIPPIGDNYHKLLVVMSVNDFFVTPNRVFIKRSGTTVVDIRTGTASTLFEAARQLYIVRMTALEPWTDRHWVF